MNYKVGQFLYICNQKKMRIMPVQVVEEIIRTTLQGEETSHIIMFPDSKKTCVPIDSISEKIFCDINTVKAHMINNATDAIERMSLSAVTLQKQVFGMPDEKNVLPNKNDVQEDVNNDIIMVDLGGGVKAKLNQKNLEEMKSK